MSSCRLKTEIVEANRCVGCGICRGVCPRDAVQLRRSGFGDLNPVFLADRCTGCDFCAKFCPAVKMQSEENPYPAKWTELRRDGVVYLAHAGDGEVRKACASGGFVTAFLIGLMRRGLIDGCASVCRVEGQPLQSVVRLSLTPEEILESRGSKYSPTDYSGIVAILKESPARRIAIVGLPCHLHGIHAILKQYPKLQEKVFCSLSLVCGHIPTFRAYDYLLDKAGIAPENLASLDNRGDGWPGFLKLTTKDGGVWKRRYGDALSWGMLLGSPFCTTRGCAFCTDPAGFHADISVSDAWLKRCMTPGNPGENLIWVRNNALLEVLEELERTGELKLAPASVEEFEEANARVFLAKSACSAVFMRFFGNAWSEASQLHEIYRGLSLFRKMKIYFLCLNTFWYWKVHRLLPLNKCLLLYGKVVSYITFKGLSL